MTDRPPIEIADTWFRHLAERDVDAVMSLAADDIEVGGARGSGSDMELLREWVTRMKAVVIPRRWFTKDDVVVVEQEAVWYSRAGEDMGRRVMITTFRIENGHIGGIYRHDDLAAAVTIGGLDASHELDPPEGTGTQARPVLGDDS
ncbi:MAG TPA: nuclear transport factor 2 family protein [Thermomicrobiales bacterium]|nr:nuclear transport factor 2 family protein [Thermomicrobiales bacterium]